MADGSVAFFSPAAALAAAATGSSAAARHLLYDIHGSTRAILDAAAAITQQYGYTAHGEHLTGTNLTAAAAALTRLLYSGEFTGANGTQYLRARWYNSSTGTFNRLDPFAGNTSDPLSLNKYLYTHGNPVMGIDPSGRFTKVELLVAIGIGFNIISLAVNLYSLNKAYLNNDPVQAGYYQVAVGIDIALLLIPGSGPWIKPGLQMIRGGASAINLAAQWSKIRSIWGLISLAVFTSSGGLEQFDLPDGYSGATDAAETSNYRDTFFKAFPDQNGKVWVHHAIEQQVLTKYPGLFSADEIHSLFNLRGIPKSINNELHLSTIRLRWNEFYKNRSWPTRQEVIDFAKTIDEEFGHLFEPPVK